MIPVFALLKGFSPKTWMLIGVSLAVIALCTKVLFWIEGKEDALEQAQVQIDALTTALQETQEQRREAEIERDTVNAVLASTTALQAMNQQLLLELQEEQRAIRVDVNKRKDIFDKHDLQYLANAKPRLIERRMRAGTQGILNELELVVNSN